MLPCHGRGCGFEPRRSRHCFMEEPVPIPFEEADPSLGEAIRKIVHGEHPTVKSVVFGHAAISQVLGPHVAAAMRAKGRRVHVTRKPVIASPKVSRNDPCPCGSGKKFKKCCG